MALLLLIIPAGTLLADSLDENQHEEEIQTTTGSEQGETEEEPAESESEEGGGHSAIASERIVTAESLGITPGHLNLIDKLAAISGKTREELLPEWQDASAQAIMQEISRLRFEAKGKEWPGKPHNTTLTGPTEETAGETSAAIEESHGHGKNKS